MGTPAAASAMEASEGVRMGAVDGDVFPLGGFESDFAGSVSWGERLSDRSQSVIEPWPSRALRKSESGLSNESAI